MLFVGLGSLGTLGSLGRLGTLGTDKQTSRQTDKRTSRRGRELHLGSVFVFVVSSVRPLVVVFLGKLGRLGRLGSVTLNSLNSLNSLSSLSSLWSHWSLSSLSTEICRRLLLITREHYISRRLSSACVIVSSSTYSNSSPKPMPRAMVVTLTSGKALRRLIR